MKCIFLRKNAVVSFEEITVIKGGKKACVTGFKKICKKDWIL
jgi:hypothetical protein